MLKLFFRFKLEETKDEFKKVFEDCQEVLRKKGTPLKDTPAKSNAEKVNKHSQTKKILFEIVLTTNMLTY